MSAAPAAPPAALIQARCGLQLCRHGLYITPTGRLCQWVPGHAGSQGAEEFVFVRPGEPARHLSPDRADGMVLSADNLRILRRVA
jgi:hypothetical protein